MKKLLLAFIIIALSPILVSASSNLADRLAGRILLQVEASGEAYYINPSTKLRHYLGRPSDAFNLMRSLGLGVSNSDLNKIQTANDLLKYEDNTYGFSFMYPKEAIINRSNNVVYISSSSNLEDYFSIVIYENPSKLNLEAWFDAQFNQDLNKDCNMMNSNIKISDALTYLFSAQSMDQICTNAGYYTISPDQSLVLKWDFGQSAPLFLDTIRGSFQFN
jgi:hypothetical protein